MTRYATGEAALWSSPTKRISGISKASVASDAGVVGSEIAGDDELSQRVDISLSWQFSIAPTAGKQLLLYLQFQSDDNATWEDGDAATQPITRLIGSVDVAADDRWHHAVFPLIEIPPRPFRFIVWNDGTGQTATVTLDIEIYSD